MTLNLLDEVIESSMKIDRNNDNNNPINIEANVKILTFIGKQMLGNLKNHGKRVFRGEIEAPSKEHYDRLKYVVTELYKKLKVESKRIKKLSAEANGLDELGEVLVHFKRFLDSWMMPKLSISPSARMAKQLPAMIK